jgi:hypothetical protein
LWYNIYRKREGKPTKPRRENKMTVLEKLAELELDYCIDFDHELIIYGEGDEYEEGNDAQALAEMRVWVEEHKALRPDGYVYVDGYCVIFQDDEQYPIIYKTRGRKLPLFYA